MKLTIRPAEAADLAVVEALHAEAVAWLAEKGLDQWQPGQPSAPRDRPGSYLTDAIRAGTCWVVETDTEIVATVTVDDHADGEFWEPDEADQALYVHRMIVRRTRAGCGLGIVLLAWADVLAARAGRPNVRLDAWRTNTALHEYYERVGFTRVRTVALAHRGSGALFERPVLPPPTHLELRMSADGRGAEVEVEVECVRGRGRRRGGSRGGARP